MANGVNYRDGVPRPRPVEEMPAGLKRQLEGGRAEDYEWRRARRGGTGARQAPGWGAEAASAFLSTLRACQHDDGTSGLGKQLWLLLTGEEMYDRVMGLLPRYTSEEARENIKEVIFHHAERAAQEASDLYDSAAQVITHRCLKPLRELARKCGAVTLLAMPVDPALTTFHGWLAADPAKERMRSIANNARITGGLANWDLSWLDEVGVVAYERAAGRVRNERPGGGQVRGDFARGLVHTRTLPTAVANGSDHYVVVSPGAPPRFMTVEEVCRAMGLPRSSPVTDALTADGLGHETCTAIQAVSALGDA